MARERGIRAEVVDHKKIKPRSVHEEHVIEILRDARVDLVCLAGYMRLLTPTLVQAFPGRILNIHPSLLPAYRGVAPVERQLRAGAAHTGVSVHAMVDAFDAGPVLAQTRVALSPDATVGHVEQVLAALGGRLVAALVRDGDPAAGAAQDEGTT